MSPEGTTTLSGNAQEEEMGGLFDDVSEEQTTKIGVGVSTSKGTLLSPLPIAVMTKIDQKVFEQKYRMQKPVLLKGAANGWKDLFLTLHNGIVDPHMISTPAKLLAARDGIHFFKLGLTEGVEGSLEDMAGQFAKNEREKNQRTYVRSLVTHDPYIQQLHDSVSPILQDDALNQPGIWLSSKGCITPLHYDTCHGFLCQVSGTKTFTYFPPTESRLVYPQAGDAVNVQSSRVSVDEWEAEAKNGTRSNDRSWVADFPALGEALCYRVTVEEGDILYTPPFWWHHVVSNEQACSVLMAFDMNPTEQTEKLPTEIAGR
eukprot:Clim_evm8s223 gene=Clim_evmTU8s223